MHTCKLPNGTTAAACVYSVHRGKVKRPGLEEDNRQTSKLLLFENVRRPQETEGQSTETRKLSSWLDGIVSGQVACQA